MNLIPWKQNTPLSQLQHDIDRTFDRFFGNGFGLGPAAFPLYPPIAVHENTKAVVVTAELPGVNANELDISVDGNVLTLRGEKREEKHEKDDKTEGMQYSCVERTYGSFMRRIELPTAVDGTRAEATLQQGVLTLKLPKVASEKTKTIKVHAK